MAFLIGNLLFMALVLVLSLVVLYVLGTSGVIMDYVEWVEKVLQAAVEARKHADEISYEFHGMRYLHIGGELRFRVEDLQNSNSGNVGKTVLNALSKWQAWG